MHLKCECLIQNNAQLPVKKKPIRCVLTYGNVKKRPFFRVAAQNQKDLLTCSLINNVEKMFDKFLDDGKLTIRFKEPKLDVLISKADPTVLKSFYHGIRTLIDGKIIDEKQKMPLLKTSHLKKDDFAKPVKVLTIENRHDYPFYTTLPGTLHQFTANHCLLTKFDQRILKLQNLCVLNLADNKLSRDVENLNFSCLQNLVYLDLSRNGLDFLDPEIFYGNLPENLVRLNLSGNFLTKLPDRFFMRLKNLHSLDLSDNRLGRLSARIYDFRANLKHLNLARNNLHFLPSIVRYLKLDAFDASDNPWEMKISSNSELLKFHLPVRGQLPKLLYLAMLAVAKLKLPTQILPQILQLQMEQEIQICCNCAKYLIPHRIHTVSFQYLQGRDIAISSVVSGVFPIRNVYCFPCNSHWMFFK